MAKEVEVAPALTIGADLDPCLGDLDDLEGDAPDELHFAWDGPDDWLREETGEIKGEEFAGTVITPCKEDDTPCIKLQYMTPVLHVISAPTKAISQHTHSYLHQCSSTQPISSGFLQSALKH
jgi:hypothetical protein